MKQISAAMSRATLVEVIKANAVPGGMRADGNVTEFAY